MPKKNRTPERGDPLVSIADLGVSDFTRLVLMHGGVTTVAQLLTFSVENLYVQVKGFSGSEKEDIRLALARHGLEIEGAPR